ncbi:MAG: YerC/YecD family TrpR-related protein [Ruminococcus sp.]|nr:YerC/YecD family TrpR-related protein [Ruminococcus sp.]
MKDECQESNLAAFFEAVLTLQTSEECYAFFKDLCTYQELNAISQRLQVAKLLHAGTVFHKITDQTGVSATTISRVNRTIKDGMGGYQLIFDRICDTKGEKK